MLQPSWRSPSLNTDATGAALPDALGPFRVLKRIGTGSLGPVFHAYEEQRDRHVAAKVLTLNLPPDRNRQLIARFEELITADLVHPGIAAPVATGMAGSSVYLAHELVDAEAFDAIARQYGPAPPDAALRVATQLAGALDFAAAVNIVHGTMHPADVLILSDETRLTGLGVARTLEQLGIVIPVRRAYSAPERARGAAWDRRADVYTLAVLLCELLCGRPWTTTAGEPSAPLPDIPGVDRTKLREALARALADKPDDRFSTALEFVEAASRAFPSTRTSEAIPASAVAVDRRKAVQSGEPIIPIGSNPALPSAKARSLDFELRAAEQKRYADAEVAPAVAVESIGKVPIDASRDRRGVTRGGEPAIPIVVPGQVPAPASARSRSMGPLAIILVLGIGLGFAVGYGFKRQSPSEPQSESSAGSAAPQPTATATPVIPPAPPSKTAPAAPPQTSSGREFTENAVPPRPSPSKPASPVEPRAKSDATTQADVEGRVLIRSEPAGATVIVDGREYGITPAVVRGLGRGNHRIRLVRDGYIPEERVVQISRAQPAPSLVVTLETRRPATERVSQSTAPSESAIETYTGLLVVESLPAGATVYLDNKSVGKTPLTLRSVHAGEHVIRLERDGYRRWSRSVRVVATERNRVTASMER